MDDDDGIWFSSELARTMMGCKDPANQANRLFTAHKDEFEEGETHGQYFSVDSTEKSKGRPSRYFSLEGLALLCMFAGTPVAKKVRKWGRKIMKEVWTTGPCG